MAAAPTLGVAAGIAGQNETMSCRCRPADLPFADCRSDGRRITAQICAASIVAAGHRSGRASSLLLHATYPTTSWLDHACKPRFYKKLSSARNCASRVARREVDIVLVPSRVSTLPLVPSFACPFVTNNLLSLTYSGPAFTDRKDDGADGVFDSLPPCRLGRTIKSDFSHRSPAWLLICSHKLF